MGAAVPKDSMRVLELLDSKRKLVNALEGLLRHESFIENVRAVSSLQSKFENIESSLFDLFAAIASELDGYPEERVRIHWNKEALAVLDDELNVYKNKVMPIVIDGCNKLLQLLALDVDELKVCRVCGHLSDEYTWGKNGDTASCSICACCGTIFGDEDSDLKSIRIKRRSWVASGAQWYDALKKPMEWDVEASLLNIAVKYI